MHVGPESRSRTKTFLKHWLAEYPAAFWRNGNHLLFGIRNRLFVFIGFLIVTALFISNAKIKKTQQYVVNREKVDLQDESRNSQLDIQLALQTAYCQIVTGSSVPDRKDDFKSFDLTLSPVDAARGVSVATVMLEITEDELSDFFVGSDQFETRESKRRFDLGEPSWSRIAWGDEGKDCFIDVLIPAGHFNDDSFRREKKTAWQVRLYLNDLVQQLTEGARVLSYFVGVDGNLCLGPNGRPLVQGQTITASIPGEVLKAIDLFKTESERQIRDTASQSTSNDRPQSSIHRFGLLYSAEDGEGVATKDMMVGGVDQDTLVYGETLKLDRGVFESLKGDALEAIEQRLRGRDPFVRIDPVNPEVGEIRIRASDQASLELLKGYVALYIAEGDPSAELTWRGVDLDNFVLSVHRVVVPSMSSLDAGEGTNEGPDNDDAGQGNAEMQVLGYLVRASSLEEIRHSAMRDLHNLKIATYVACLFALLLTVLVAHYLVGPMSRMTRVAQLVSESLLKSDQQSKNQLDELLAELPTKRRDETGALAKQFEKTSRELLRANREMEQSALEKIDRQKQLDQTEREKSIAEKVGENRVQLLATVSHDMRQPLVPIFHHSERLLQDQTLDEEQDRRIRAIKQNATELSFLIEDILDYKRILAGDVQIAVESLDLDELLGELLSHYDDAAERRHIQLSKTNMWSGNIHADRMRLKRVLNNLISNAIKATRNGEVRLLISPMGVDHIEISVTDTGCGMDELQQRLVFVPSDRRAEIERQHMGTSKKRDSNSTGLGLYISKQLVEAMGGEIRFTSVENKGTNFIIRLPVGHPDHTERKTGHPDSHIASSISDDSAMTHHSRAAVVVDDDEQCGQILCDMLKDLGYESTVASDGESAIELIARTLPDLITLDVFMPGIDGWETLERLKTNPLTEHIPVVMVTVYPDESKATLLGASGFVPKPIQKSSLTRSVLGTIGSTSGARILAVDDDPQCLNELVELLRPLRCDVSLARDGYEALSAINDMEDGTFDLAIIDLYMPNFDGFALIERLGEMPETRQIPIIVLSASDVAEVEQDQLTSRVAHFFNKGTVDFSTLRGEIARLLPRHPSASKPHSTKQTDTAVKGENRP